MSKYFSSFLCIVFSALSLHTQAQHTLQPVIAGPSDIHNTPVGSNISVRCQLLDETGQEVFRANDNDTSVASLLELSINRQPRNGFNGSINGASAQGIVQEAGVYVFSCRSQNNRALPSFNSKVASMAARSLPIAATSFLMQSLKSDIPRTKYEKNEQFRLSLKSFATAGKNTSIKPSNIQVIFREGHQAQCQGNAPLANRHFHQKKHIDWSQESGHVYHFKPKKTGNYTIIASQLAQADGSAICDAIPLQIIEDANEPVVTIKTPKKAQLKTARDLMRISGEIIETGSGIEKVIVSNGHWTEEARVFNDRTRNGRFKFFSDLPYEQGLSIITVKAIDKSGKVGVDTKVVSAGKRLSPIITSERNSTYLGNNELQLALGRSLLLDNQGAIDSLEEVIDIAPPLLEAVGYGINLPSTAVADSWWGDVVPGIFSFSMTVDFTGNVKPGKLRYSITPKTERMELNIFAPLKGNINIDPAIGFDGTAKIDGGVKLVLPLQFTDIGGLSAVLKLDEVRVEDRLRLAIDSAGADRISTEMTSRILDMVESQFHDFVIDTFKCKRANGRLRRCQAEHPLAAHNVTDGLPHEIRLHIDQWSPFKERFDLDLPIPYLKNAPLNLGIGLNWDIWNISNNRIDLHFSTLFRAKNVNPDSPFKGFISSHSGDRTPQENIATALDLKRLFGTGNRDVQGGIHINAINELLAQAWAADELNVDLKLVDLLSMANFFSSAGDELKARIALDNARFKATFLAPPRLTFYDGAPELYAEIGPLKVELDFTESYDSKLVFEGGLITKVDITANNKKNGIKLSLSNPTGCTPNTVQFMNCKGHYYLGLKERVGLTEFSKRPSLINEASMKELLTTLQIMNSNGNYKSYSQLNTVYNALFSLPVAAILKEPFNIELPEVPIPSFEFGNLKLAPLTFSKVNIPQRATGGSLSRGWIAFEFDLGEKQP